MRKEKLLKAEEDILKATQGCLPEHPDQHDVKRVLLSFYHDFASWVPLWLEDLTARAVTTKGTEIISQIHARRDELKLGSRLERVCRLALSEHSRKTSHARACQTDYAARISESMRACPAFGFASLYLLNANSQRLSAWMIRNLKTEKENDLEYFEIHFQKHHEFSAGLMYAFLAETEPMHRNVISGKIDEALLITTQLSDHIFRS